MSFFDVLSFERFTKWQILAIFYRFINGSPPSLFGASVSSSVVFSMEEEDSSADKDNNRISSRIKESTLRMVLTDKLVRPPEGSRRGSIKIR